MAEHSNPVDGIVPFCHQFQGASAGNHPPVTGSW
jgi:hypothetical protein